MIKVLVVGDQSILLQGVKQVLDDSADIVPVLESRMGLVALEKIHLHSLVDAMVVVVDQESLDIEPMLTRIHALRARMPILVLGGPEAGLPHWGGCVWLPKNSSPEQLVAEIRSTVRYATYEDHRPHEVTMQGARTIDERRGVHAED
jgi:DNA-binding response OmpR family regulator